MKTKDLLIIATAALGTATLTVAFHASPLISGNDANPLAATIAKPKLTANGIEMTLSAANGREFKAGDQPAFELQAVNTLGEPSEVAICATLSAFTVGSPMSRIGPIPSVLWHEELALKLGPNETKALTLAARTNLPANSSISVFLSQAGQTGKATAAGSPGIASAAPLMRGGLPGIVAMRFSTVPPVPAPAYADAATAKPTVIPAPR
ncbi:MAG: hypothetical protein ABSG78_09695 [Verrucomicrobiota bacterium]|jgi:hypothetical protein